MRLQRRIILLSALLATVITAGTVGFVTLEGWSVFDGFYLTLTTLTTIGYGETHPLSHWGRVFNVALIVVGFTTLFALVGTFTEWILQVELESRFGARRMERQLSKLKDHYVICGIGRVGRAVAAEFSAAGASYVVVETDQEQLKWALTRDLPLVVGNATKEEVLRQAGVERAKGLIAAVAGDAQNIYIALTARELNPTIKIVARATDEGAERTLKRAGADLIVSPYAYSGQHIARSLLFPHVIDLISVGEAGNRPGAPPPGILMEEFRVSPQSPLAGRTLAQTNLLGRDRGLILVGIKRHGQPMVFNPVAEDRIEAGDAVIAMGERASLKRLEEQCEGATS